MSLFQIPKELVEAYINDKLVLFIGSGLSKIFGLPNWKELIEKNINYIKEKNGANLEFLLSGLNSGYMPPIHALDLIEANGMKKYCLESISQELKINQDSGDFSLHKLIYKFNPKIITTNYDHAFELALGDRVNKINYDSIFRLATKDDQNNYLIKIHGDIDNPDKCIYFKSDYEKHYSDGETAHLFEFKKIISDKSILFIGYSNSDPYIINIFDYINKIYNGYSSKHYLITTEKNFSHNYIQKIEIGNYEEDLNKLIHQLIELKDSQSIIKNKEQTIIEIEEKNANFKTKDPIVNILFPDSVDRDFNFKVEQILKPFQSYKIIVRSEFLNLSSVRDIDEGYVFVFTRTVKGNILIEDEYLKSKQTSLLDFIDEFSKGIDGIFLFTDKDLMYNEADIKVPIAFYFNDFDKENDLKNRLSGINHKLFRQNIINPDKIINPERFKFYPFCKGTYTYNPKIPFISQHLDFKLLNNFIGRKTDLENIIRKLIDLEFENKILTIKGSGGIGKTTIVSKAVIELTRRKVFKEIHFITCQSIFTFENFQFQVSRCFNLASSIELEGQILANYKGKERVIILDNFETLLNVPESDKIINLVTFLADYSMIVTTTRQLLNLEFEEIYELRNMTSEEGTTLFKTFFKSPISAKEELFLRNQIVEELLNNNPLAIKLVAKGNIHSKDLHDLHKELKDNIFHNEEIEKIFEHPEDINIEKSKSLYHSIKYSYDKLTEKEKLAFELLSLFPDGIHMKNFTEFTKKNNSRSQIVDRDIKLLEDKSLLESSNGFLKLQSIINRFSYFHFEKREPEIKKIYYIECYKFNTALESIISSKKFFRNSDSLSFHDNNLNNYLKCIEIIDFIEEPKENLIDFIDNIGTVFRKINQINDISKVITDKFKLFEDDPKNILTLELILDVLYYWKVNFEKACQSVFEKVPLETLPNYLKYAKDKNYNKIEQIIFWKAASIYDCEGYSLQILKCFLGTKAINHALLYHLYKLGFIKLASVVEKIDSDKEFFNFEVQLANGYLNKISIDSYIQSLFSKETLEIVQSSYTKLKFVNGSELIDTTKLVVTNPYTKGFILLINAVQTEELHVKINLFEQSLKELYHIKFYYLEALLTYCKILKQNNYPGFTERLIEGRQLCDNFNFCHLSYLFKVELGITNEEYNEEENYLKLGLSKKDLDEMIMIYKEEYQ